MDPDTGVETIESILSFGVLDDQTLISFNQTKNPRSIGWYVICKYCESFNEEITSVDLIIDGKSNVLKTGKSYNNYDLKTQNSSLFRKVDYFRINEKIISDINKCNELKLEFESIGESSDFILAGDKLAAVKDWIKNIAIPK